MAWDRAAAPAWSGAGSWSDAGAWDRAAAAVASGVSSDDGDKHVATTATDWGDWDGVGGNQYWAAAGWFAVLDIAAGEEVMPILDSTDQSSVDPVGFTFGFKDTGGGGTGERLLITMTKASGSKRVTSSVDWQPPDTDWHHFAIKGSNKAGGNELWVDGVKLATLTDATSQRTGATNRALTCGAAAGVWTGRGTKVGHFAVWDPQSGFGELSTGDAAALYNGGVVALPSTLHATAPTIEFGAMTPPAAGADVEDADLPSGWEVAGSGNAVVWADIVP